MTPATSKNPAAFTDDLSHDYVAVVGPDEHHGKVDLDDIARFTDGYSRPALLRGMVDINPELATKEFFEAIGSDKRLQWREKQSDAPVAQKAADGTLDYNYISGKKGTGAEFLADVFDADLDVYSMLGGIDHREQLPDFDHPNEWGRAAFDRVREEIFSSGWLDIPNWHLTGHMFFGHSTQQFGEPQQGAVGSDWHMFPTLNVFVMIAGRKQWMTRPPHPGDQFRDYDKMFPTSSGREAPAGDFECDTMYLEPGDVLVNPPFEWHKVLNDEGLSLGGAFRVIDTEYLADLETRENLDLKKADIRENEDLAHFITSVSYASRSGTRAGMILNDLEYVYLRKRGTAQPVEIGH